ncbi:hypothetical protein CN918_30260 [Priestia megaterium]|nr:hypothetical protein CN918_30260 [Priestia megaterium]
MNLICPLEHKNNKSTHEGIFTLDKVANGCDKTWMKRMKAKGFLFKGDFDNDLMSAVINYTKEEKEKFDKLKIPYEAINKIKLDENAVEIHGYPDLLVDNSDGVFDNYGSAWFVVPIEWAEEMVKQSDFKNLEEFFDECTYDNVIGWLDKAADDGVLLECGIGSVHLKRPIQ